MNTLYTAGALSTGEGRNGHVTSTDGRIDLDLAIPREMGGSGKGSNPEQLFAAGYAACFHSALQLVARQQKVDATDSTVRAIVHIGPIDGGAFGLAVELEIGIPLTDAQTAQELADAAHRVCPYSNATRGNIDVAITVANR